MTEPSPHLHRVRSLLRQTPMPPEARAELDQMRAAVLAEARQEGIVLDQETWALAGRQVGRLLRAAGWTEDDTASFITLFWGCGLEP